MNVIFIGGGGWSADEVQAVVANRVVSPPPHVAAPTSPSQVCNRRSNQRTASMRLRPTTMNPHCVYEL
eukprot:1962834-Prymnesium_polylepis.1